MLAFGAAELPQQAAFRAGVEEVREGALDAVAAERKAKVRRGDFGHSVSLVEHQKIAGKEHAARFGPGGSVGLGAAGIDQREEQGVVDDDDVRGA